MVYRLYGDYIIHTLNTSCRGTAMGENYCRHALLMSFPEVDPCGKQNAGLDDAHFRILHMFKRNYLPTCRFAIFHSAEVKQLTWLSKALLIQSDLNNRAMQGPTRGKLQLGHVIRITSHLPPLPAPTPRNS